MFVAKEKQTPQDWQAIGHFMAEYGLPIDSDIEIRQFTSGMANLNYLLQLTDGRQVVMRRPPEGPLPPGAYDLPREFSIYEKLGKTLPFVPEGLLLCEDTAIIGVPFFIVEYCAGTALHKHSIPEALTAQPMIGDRLCRLLIESLVELHRLKPKAIGLDNLGHPDGFIARQIRGWRKRGTRALTPEQIPRMEKLCHWLAEQAPPGQPPTLVHHDYKLDNILIDLDRLEISAIIDWEMATIGDPLFDLALTLSVWGEPNDQYIYKTLSMMPCHLEGWWSRQKALETYQTLAGIEISENQWKFYWVLAMLRMGVVFGQLDRLYKEQPYMKNKANPNFHISADEFSPLATKILSQGEKLLTQERIDF